jgi:pantoate--beta-alanine ligase
MYPSGFKTHVTVSGITEILCGKSRQGHFDGVTTVVNKLFNIIKPDNAYFGQKDAQQSIVIKKMVSDLNMGIKIIVCPIVREDDGLAMSSRNVYLSQMERKAAVILSKSLLETTEIIKNGERRKEKILEHIKSRISNESMGHIEYIAMVDGDTLEEVKTLKGKMLIALAVKFGATRLIDNIILEV